MPNTQKMVHPDLLVAPQKNAVIPGDHLTKEEQENAIQAWEQWGYHPIPPNADTWTAHIIHMIDGKLQPIRVREIPKI